MLEVCVTALGLVSASYRPVKRSLLRTSAPLATAAGCDDCDDCDGWIGFGVASFKRCCLRLAHGPQAIITSVC